MRKSDLQIGLLFFGISLAVKLPYLGSFLTIDEPRWIRGAGQFLIGLASGDLGKTYWHFHPGITITWGEVVILWLQSLWAGNAGLEEFVEFQMSNLDLSVGAMRLSGVLLTSLTLPFIFGLARPLVGKWPGILGVGLLAIDPFWVAHARIVNGDALTAVLMLAAYLAFARLLTTPKLKLAVLSGLFAGLAFLTKLPSQILVPGLLLLAAAGYIRDRNWRFWTQALLLSGLSATVVFVALWPTMWVAPVQTLQAMFVDTFEVGDIGGRDKVEFFLGQVRSEQSLLFYPLALLFRLTPVNLIGSVLALGVLVASKAFEAKRVTALLFVLIGLVIVLANLSPKKADRYALSVIVTLDLLAGVGWMWLLGKAAAIAAGRVRVALAVTALVAGQTIFVLLNYPYVLTYYNPLLGGYAKAVEMVPVGRGEGLEQAAAWINRQPDGRSATISPYYRNVTNPYLAGKSLGFSKTGKTQVLADYVVFYITQTQRRLPYPGLVAYFQKQTPAYVVKHGQTPYVWVYKRPLPIKKLEGEAEIIGRAQVVGYYRSEAHLKPGNSTDIILYFLTRDQALPANEDFKVSLVDGNGVAHGHWQGDAGNEWIPEAIIEWRGRLTVPPALPPGDYRLRVSLIDTNIDSEVTFFAFKDEIITVEPPTS